MKQNTSDIIKTFSLIEEEIGGLRNSIKAGISNAHTLDNETLILQYNGLKFTFDALENAFNELFSRYLELQNKVIEFRMPYEDRVCKMLRRIYWITIALLFASFANLDIIERASGSIVPLFGFAFSGVSIDEVVALLLFLTLVFHCKICWCYHVVLSQHIRLHGDVYKSARSCELSLEESTSEFSIFLDRCASRGILLGFGEVSSNRIERYRIMSDFDSDRRKIIGIEDIAKIFFGIFLTIFVAFVYKDVSVFLDISGYWLFSIFLFLMLIIYMFPFAFNHDATCSAAKVFLNDLKRNSNIQK